jgi:hypothetical protein
VSNVARFLARCQVSGSNVVYHRETGGAACPCRTPEGFKDLRWHIANPGAPECNEQGLLPAQTENVTVKGFVQPVQAGAVRRLTGEQAVLMFGQIQQDDHLGILPLTWSGVSLDFYSFSQTGEDYILYDGRRFFVVAANKIPDPADGLPHHWEIGLRLVKTARAV